MIQTWRLCLLWRLICQAFCTICLYWSGISLTQRTKLKFDLGETAGKCKGMLYKYILFVTCTFFGVLLSWCFAKHMIKSNYISTTFSSSKNENEHFISPFEVTLLSFKLVSKLFILLQVQVQKYFLLLGYEVSNSSVNVICRTTSTKPVYLCFWCR